MNVAARILANGADAATAIMTPDAAITFRELRLEVTRMARGLLALGHEKGERIGIFSENSPFFIAAYLGIIRAGLVAVPLQTELSPEALARIVTDSSMSRLLVSQRLVRRLPTWTTTTNVPLFTEKDFHSTHPQQFGAPSNDLAPVPEAEDLPDHEPHDLAALMFTSGSTGSPKGVMISHRNIECNTQDIISYLGLASDDRGMVVLPFHYCFGLSLLHTHLMAGASLFLNSTFKAFPEQMLLELQERECTGLAGVPSTFQILLRKTRFCQLSFPKLRWFQQAGGKLPNPCIQELLRAFPNVRFFLMYGQTEATARLSYLPPERLGDKLGSIGRGLPSTRLAVLKPDGSRILPGSSETGEIVATGDNIALGYWKDPRETAAFFKNGRLHTGDLARVDEDGFIFFVERERDILKPGGNRVSAREVEDVLAELPEVVEVAVVGAPDELLGEVIRAFVVLRPDAHLTAAELQTHCRKRLPAFKTPQRITLLDEMPHNSAGKILKVKLRQMAGDLRSIPNRGADQSHQPVSEVIQIT